MTDSLTLEAFFRGRYRILTTERDRDLVEIVISNLDHGVRRIEELFSTKAESPFLNVFICPSRSIFDDFVQVITTVPTSAGRIGQPQGHDLYILSPKSYRSDAPFYGRDQPPFYDPVDFRRILVHELVHVWEELSSPREAMEVGEDWFSEGMAMYIAEHNREARFEIELRADFSRGIIPKPEELSGDREYSWGCVLFEFLLEKVGPKPLLEMITKTTHENIITLLQLEPSSFWERYLDYVDTRMSTLSQ